MKRILPFIFVLVGCASNLEPVKNTDDVKSTDDAGYFAVNFNNMTDYSFRLFITNLEIDKRFIFNLDKPQQPTIGVNLLWKRIYEQKVGDPINIPYTIIPVTPGKYRFRYGDAHSNSNDMGSLKVEEDTILVNSGQLKYLGDFEVTTKKLFGIFKISTKIKKLDIDTVKVNSVFKNIPHEIHELYFK